MTARFHTTGKEMLRIQGCFMYMINECGAVGAFLGYKTLTLVVPECSSDLHPIHAYLKVSCWLYPLARSFSPIYCWGVDRMVLPDPFSRVDRPAYIVIRLPHGCTDHQKSTLWNLLDMFGHVRGNFCSSNNSHKEGKKFFLTEIAPFDDYELHNAPPNSKAGDIKVLKPLTFPRLEYKGRALYHEPVKLCVALHVTDRVGVSREKKGVVTSRTCCYQPGMCHNLGYKIVPESHTKSPPVQSEPENKKKKEVITAGGITGDWVSLPDYGGSIMRQYILGPRDWQHIKVITVPRSMRIHNIVHFAVREAYRQLVRQRAEKEALGVPPSLDEKKGRLLCGFGEALSLNAFGPDEPTRLLNIYPSAVGKEAKRLKGRPAEKYLEYQHLESAARHFDHELLKPRFFLVSLEPDEERVGRMDPCNLIGALTARPIGYRYGCSEMHFAKLMTLSACEEDEVLAYPKPTNYIERRLEECEHHWPKTRPINAVLDPAYDYARFAPNYITPRVRSK